MDLKHLHYKECPVCKSRVKSETQSSQHTNGGWFEAVEFECGCIIEHLPNLDKTQAAKECPEHPVVIEKRKKRIEAKAKLRKCINSLDADIEFKEKLQIQLQV